ncbi:putative KDEL motif-containing protein 1 precursor [Corchorus olitorius]|uniref:KDEL motif-containing protein 1 n=1 Tax=Corchorus olitorius TaxID=93759 RepID=A0A1R3HIM4_9ROSI|nr:putative KDEL motif-containing protein 1 precursor [Corchorus olitorius]
MTSDGRRISLKRSPPPPESSAGANFLRISLKPPRSRLCRTNFKPPDLKIRPWDDFKLRGKLWGCKVETNEGKGITERKTWKGKPKETRDQDPIFMLMVLCFGVVGAANNPGLT